MDWIEQFLVTFLSFISALGVYGISQWYLNKKEKEKEKIMQNNFLLLIKKEILFNIQLVNTFIKGDRIIKEIPVGRLKNEIQRGCWSKLVEYRHKNLNLISSIDDIYTLFDAVNNILSSIPFYYSDFFDPSPYLKKAKSGIEVLTKTCNKLGEDIKKDIDNELEKTKI